MMIIVILSCFTIMVSAVPVTSNVRPPLQTQAGATQTEGVQPVEVTDQQPEAQRQAVLPPSLNQPQSGVTQQPNPQLGPQIGPELGPQLTPLLQQYMWPPQGGSPLLIPMQPSIQGSQFANQLALPQQPLIFPPYGYIPLFAPPYRNQLMSPYGYPMVLDAPPPQSPANQQLPYSPVLPAENAAGPATPSVNAPQPVQQQQQAPQIVYMLQQPMSSQLALGGLSSEELEMAAKMSQLGVYMPTILNNQPAGAVQPEMQAAAAAGLTNPEQQGIAPTMGISAAGVQQRQTCSGSQLNANNVPAGLEGAAQEAATAQTPAQVKVEPTQGNLI